MKLKNISLKMPKGYNKPIHAAVIILSLFGVLMVISASMTIDATPRKLFIDGAKEFTFVVVAYIGMVYASRKFSMKAFKENYFRYLFVMVIALGATLAFPAVNGAKAWINIRVMTIQPSEFAKIFVMLTIAVFLADRRRNPNIKLFDLIKYPVTIVLGIVAYVTLFQHDLGSAVVIMGIAYIAMLVPSNETLRKMQKIMGIVALVGIVLLFLFSSEFGVSIIEKFNVPSYMIGRFKTSADPFLDKYGEGYQIYNGLVAMVKGGFFGVGYGNSVIKYGYLPEAHTDFILAIVIEEFGMLGFAVVFIGYGAIIYQLIKYAIKVPKESDKIILIGTVTYIIIHFVFNIGGITALIPLTGVPLLFISKGGSSRLAIMLAIGLTQNIISKYNMGLINEKRKERKRQEALEIRRRQGVEAMRQEDYK